MLVRNEKRSILGRTCWDIVCSNCKVLLGSTVAGDDHTYERGGICPYCKKDVNGESQEEMK